MCRRHEDTRSSWVNPAFFVLASLSDKEKMGISYLFSFYKVGVASVLLTKLLQVGELGGYDFHLCICTSTYIFILRTYDRYQDR